jgi:GNAT superfamily N-acetyltransferase
MFEDSNHIWKCFLSEAIPVQWQRDQYVIDTDRGRLDMRAIVGWIGTSYWAAERSEDAIHRSWDAAGIVFGLYVADRQVGCARVATDFVAIAYLADVFLEPSHRGKGIGLWMVRTIMEHPELSSVRWLLHTADAHGLYRQVGFRQPGPRVMERP